MVELSRELLEFIAEDINSHDKKESRRNDLDRWLMYNGKTLDIIRKSISREFKRPETVEELFSRLVPLNIIEKIINKLSGVYVEDPYREVIDQNEADTDLLENYEDALRVNARFKEGNRYFKLFKRNLTEVFIDKDGTPQLRNLPRHTYEVYSFDSQRPDMPNLIVKIIRDDEIKEKQILAVWTDERHLLINGEGKVLVQAMMEMENPEGINPFGRMPFVYINAATYDVNPIPDDDLLRIAIAIPVVLTDLLFACKYQCWSLIYTIGDVGDLPSNPSSVLSLDFGPDGQKPEVGTIKPEVDIQAILQLVTNLLSTLLTTKNLSAGTIKTTQSVNETISGISKVLDQAESVEDKKDQQNFFVNAEHELWHLLSNHMIPYWRSNNMLKPILNREFSPMFGISITYKEPKVLLSEKERIENSWLRLKYHFSTLARELRNLYPDMTDSQLERLENEIKEEKREAMATQVDIINGEELESEV